MADIFISYAREDRETAKALAHALADRGWSVWWDRYIPSGRRFHDVIERELTAARCVIALWSTTAPLIQTRDDLLELITHAARLQPGDLMRGEGNLAALSTQQRPARARPRPRARRNSASFPGPAHRI